jgi:NADPH:quinone reductase-like Zn-dependent oxidoreductase
LISGASIPFVGLTAYNAIVDFAQVQPQQHVLLIGAGGGVGMFHKPLHNHTITQSHNHNCTLSNTTAL